MVTIIFLVPFSVFAIVDENTTTTVWEVMQDDASSMWCKAEEDLNEKSVLANASTGYYLYCINISCVNGVNVHSIENPISSKLRCANGSTNPEIIVSSSGAFSPELKEGNSCSSTGIYAYATEKVFYDCLKKSTNDASPSLTGEYYVDNTNHTEKSSSNGIFSSKKIIFIVIIIAFLGIIGYLIFRKFRSNNQVVDEYDDE